MGKEGLGCPIVPTIPGLGLDWELLRTSVPIPRRGFWLPEAVTPPTHWPLLSALHTLRMGTWGATWETWTNIWSGFQEPEATLLRQGFL